jgi:hypothetical protein
MASRLLVKHVPYFSSISGIDTLPCDFVVYNQIWIAHPAISILLNANQNNLIGPKATTLFLDKKHKPIIMFAYALVFVILTTLP